MSYTLPSAASSTYLDPPLTHATVQSWSAILPWPSAASSCFALHSESLICPVKVCSAASGVARTNAAATTNDFMRFLAVTRPYPTLSNQQTSHLQFPLGQ